MTTVSGGVKGLVARAQREAQRRGHSPSTAYLLLVMLQGGGEMGGGMMGGMSGVGLGGVGMGGGGEMRRISMDGEDAENNVSGLSQAHQEDVRQRSDVDLRDDALTGAVIGRAHEELEGVTPGHRAVDLDQDVVDADGWLHSGDQAEVDADGETRIEKFIVPDMIGLGLAWQATHRLAASIGCRSASSPMPPKRFGQRHRR